MIASHYADPLPRKLRADADLFVAPGGEVIKSLRAGEVIRILDNSRGWAWGYAPDGTVGYVAASAL